MRYRFSYILKLHIKLSFDRDDDSQLETKSKNNEILLQT